MSDSAVFAFILALLFLVLVIRSCLRAYCFKRLGRTAAPKKQTD